MPPDLDFSVIVATVDAASSIDRCLTSIRASCEGMRSECIVVDASEDGTVHLVEQSAPDALIVQCPVGSLVPVLWAAGLQRARGRVMAFTIGQCAVSAAWAHRLQSAIASGAAGAGGLFALADDASVAARAMFLLRYSAFLVSAPALSGPAQEIAGDNAAYSRAALDRHADAFAAGFWEVEFHHLLRREKAQLQLVQGALATFSGRPSLRRLVSQRFAHGHHFGRWRVGTLGHSVLRIMLATPLVPGALVARVVRRVSHERSAWRRYATALPAVVLLAMAWACGEAAGAIASRPRGAHRAPASA